MISQFHIGLLFARPWRRPSGRVCCVFSWFLVVGFGWFWLKKAAKEFFFFVRTFLLVQQHQQTQGGWCGGGGGSRRGGGLRGGSSLLCLVIERERAGGRGRGAGRGGGRNVRRSLSLPPLRTQHSFRRGRAQWAQKIRFRCTLFTHTHTRTAASKQEEGPVTQQLPKRLFLL